MGLTKEAYNKHSDFFKILEINEKDALNENLEELSELIKKQYKTLALKCHPDKGGNDELMKELSAARNKLDDLIKNAKESTNQNFIPSPRNSSSNYFTEEYIEENRDDLDVNTCRVGKNYGRIKINYGIIDKNYRGIYQNHKLVNSNYSIVNTNHGTIEDNYGLIDENYQGIHRNHKLVNKNYGVIVKNNDSVGENHGKIGENFGAVYNKISGSEIVFDKYTRPKMILLAISIVAVCVYVGNKEPQTPKQ